MNPLLSFKDVSKGFEDVQILNEINIDIEPGYFYTLLGPSGCGKTTILKLIAGFEYPDSGDIIYKDKPIGKMPPNKRKVNTVFQDYALFPHLNVFDNIAYGLKLKKLSKSEIKRKVTEALQLVKLSGYEHRQIQGMSGGQKQRVAIARALVTHPKILLCDEATSALDPATTSSILNLLSNVNRTFGVTIMMITHEMSVIQKICHRVAVMENGEVIEMGTVKDVFSHPQTNTAKNFVSTVINTEPSKELRASFNTRKDSNFTDYKLFLDSEQIQLPILNELINEHHLNVNVLFSSMSEIQDETVCYLWLRFEHDESFNDFKLTDYLSKRHIRYEEVI